MRAMEVLLILLVLPVALGAGTARVAGAQEWSGKEGLSPWIWVVAGVPRGGVGSYLLSGFHAGTAELKLDWAWVDGEGETVADGNFTLRAGRSVDLEIPAPPALSRPASCTLLVSGLDLDPEWMVFRLWRPSGSAGGVNWVGRWLHSDPAWVAPSRIEP